MNNDALLAAVVNELIASHAQMRESLAAMAKLGPLADKLANAVEAHMKQVDSPIVHAARVVYGDDTAADLEKKGY